LLAEKLQNFAGALDHFFLGVGRVDELDAVIESRAVTDDTTEIEFEGLVGDQEFQHHAGARREFPGHEKAHAAPTEVAGFAAMIETLSVQKYRDLH